jgi:hypothetical protein
MAKVGQVVMFVSNKLDKDGKRADDKVEDKHVPLLVVNSNKDGSVDGYVFMPDKTDYLVGVTPGTPSDPGKFYLLS